MSTHLGMLSRARLVKSGRRGRSIVYRADPDALRAPLVAELVPCC